MKTIAKIASIIYILKNNNLNLWIFLDFFFLSNIKHLQNFKKKLLIDFI